MKLRIATRGSRLALWQTEHMASQLKSHGVDSEVVLLKTEGDKSAQAFNQMTGTGFFVKELETALLEGRADLAVHSLKDLPSCLPDGLVLAATPEREDARDALIVPRVVDGATRGVAGGLDTLLSAASVGTSSPRRRAFLKLQRPDLEVRELRGNVDTRLAKLERGEVQAIVLALAGLKRLGFLDERATPLATTAFVPAPGQGALGLECRADDSSTRELLSKLEHVATRTAVDAERAMVARLQSGCQAPLGVHAEILEDATNMSLTAALVSLNGQHQIRETLVGPSNEPKKLGEQVAELFLKAGAEEMLAAAREQSETQNG